MTLPNLVTSQNKSWFDVVKMGLAKRSSGPRIIKPTLSSKNTMILSGPVAFDSECAAIECLKKSIESAKDMQNIIVKVPNAARKPTNVYQVCTGSIGGFKNLVTLHDEYGNAQPQEQVFNLFKGLSLFDVACILFNDPRDILAFSELYEREKSMSDNIGAFLSIFGPDMDEESNRAVSALYWSNFFNVLASDKEAAVDMSAISRWQYIPYLEWPVSENKYLQGIRYKYLIRLLSMQFKRLRKPFRLTVLGIDRLDKETTQELEKLAQIPKIHTLYSGRYPNHDMDSKVVSFIESLFNSTECAQLMQTGQVISHPQWLSPYIETLSTLPHLQAITCIGTQEFITRYSPLNTKPQHINGAGNI
ncbi:hypothetical protein [Paraglaciecola chathamensis]|uniref:Uncharacterized protein n=1 Tax=Paraglaciecola chathamensis TaxID=368405 RepID=A0A8H9M689_9ALTE|nr:hypothetical protein [Paraglaciecola oceanifecundans]GGZ78376.1 hypothetical protein GCM10011274_40670 [Paraglaciecola oceanifecundans]